MRLDRAALLELMRPNSTSVFLRDTLLREQRGDKVIRASDRKQTAHMKAEPHTNVQISSSDFLMRVPSAGFDQSEHNKTRSEGCKCRSHRMRTIPSIYLSPRSRLLTPAPVRATTGRADEGLHSGGDQNSDWAVERSQSTLCRERNHHGAIVPFEQFRRFRRPYR